VAHEDSALTTRDTLLANVTGAAVKVLAAIEHDYRSVFEGSAHIELRMAVAAWKAAPTGVCSHCGDEGVHVTPLRELIVAGPTGGSRHITGCVTCDLAYTDLGDPVALCADCTELVGGLDADRHLWRD
jgi:hypothetical protein